jgi:hypothetical protein
VPFNKLETKHITYLIKSDLVTCAHYCNHRIKCFPKLCTKNNTNFGPSLELFFVTKFQNHGNDHGLLWVANAPTYGLNSNKTIEFFLDKYITCDSDK